MNYIKHLNGFFRRLEQDERMTAYHISLYLTCFQFWNSYRFSSSFPVIRSEMMRMARVGSVNTYARCMRQLREWGYIEYAPAANVHCGSLITCISFDTAGVTTADTAGDTLLINNTNTSKKENKQSNVNLKASASKKQLNVRTEKDYSEPL